MIERPPAVAGLFYPDDPAALEREVRRYLADASARPVSVAGAARPPALIAPHAGYRYSGPVAASAYATLSGAGGVSRVVVMGPNHTVPLQGMAVTAADRWRTPLDTVEIDAEGRDLIASHPVVRVDETPHVREHGIEVHLPFLQVVLPPGWRLLPVVVGQATEQDVADVLELVWDDDTLVVISTDLSHYHDHATATVLDERTAAAVVAGDLGALTPGAACGVHSVKGMIEAARRRHLDVRLLDRRTSADTAGDPSRVVGYASFVVEPAA